VEIESGASFDDELDIWVLTPSNIPAFAKETGRDEDELFDQWRRANNEGKKLHGFIRPW